MLLLSVCWAIGRIQHLCTTAVVILFDSTPANHAAQRVVYSLRLYLQKSVLVPFFDTVQQFKGTAVQEVPPRVVLGDRYCCIIQQQQYCLCT